MTSPTDILRFIRRYIAANKMPPTHREIADRFGISESTVRRRLIELRVAGQLELPVGKRRALRLPAGKARRTTA